jgi:hypothetical protein
MEASGEICLSATMMRRMPVLAQSQVSAPSVSDPVLDDPIIPNVPESPSLQGGQMLSTITVTAPSLAGLSGAGAAFVYGTIGGGAIGSGVGLGVGTYLAPTEMAEFVTAIRVGSGVVARTSPLWAPMVGLDTISGFSFLGGLAGSASGGLIGVGVYGLYWMSQVPLPPSGLGYGYPNGNFSPF